MKIVTFGPGSVVLLEDGRVLDLAAAAAAFGQRDDGAFSSLLSLVEAGQRGLELVGEVASTSQDSERPDLYRELHELQLQAPFPGRSFALAGANNPHHMADCYTNMGTPVSPEDVTAKARSGDPAGFWSVVRPVMGPGDDIEIPSRANGLFDYEGEPAIVVGRKARGVKADEFRDYVWGVTLVIDWSIREEIWPPTPPNPFALVKNFDSSKSIGPSIVVGELDPDDFTVETLVNGQKRQSFSSKEMIFSFGEVLEFVSRDLTLHPGDVLSLGTGAGTAMDSTVPNDDGSWPRARYLKAGDTVEVRSPGIGSLVGNVVARRDA